LKIFQVARPFDADSEEIYQSLGPAHKDSLLSLRFDGRTYSKNWTVQNSEVDIINMRLPSADFPIYMAPGVIATSDHVLPLINESIPPETERLPLRTKSGKQYTLLNLLPLYDCVNLEESKFICFDSGKVMRVEQYEFDKTSLPGASLFRTSVHPFGVFATEGLFNRDLEFKYIVESHGLTGLRFVEIWNDEDRLISS